MGIILTVSLDSYWDSVVAPLYVLYSNKKYFENHVGS